MEKEMHNNSKSKTLYELAHEEILRQIPLMIYLLVLSIAGISGNSLVCVIYTKKYALSTFRIFVTVLAAVDLFTSSVVIPLEIVQFAWQYTYDSDIACKLTLFVKAFATIMSGALLLCIAFDRFRKVCRPFSWQISFRAARNVCLGSALLSAVVSWIFPVVYGIQTKELGVYNVTISECAVTKSMKKTVFALINNTLLAVLFVGAFTGIIIMYILIAIRVKQQVKKKIGETGALVGRRQGVEMETDVGKTERKKDSDIVCSYDITGTNEIDAEDIPKCEFVVHTDCKQTSKVEMNTADGEGKDLVKDSYKVINTDSASDINAVKALNADSGVHIDIQQEQEIETDFRDADCKKEDSVSVCKGQTAASGNATDRDFTKTTKDTIHFITEREPNEANKSEMSAPTRYLKASGNQTKRYRTTLIMFIVSLAFVVSYLPLLSLLLIGYADKTFVSNLTDSGRTAYKFISRSYFLNCAVNPIIYGIWDVRFRKSCKLMLTCRKT